MVRKKRSAIKSASEMEFLWNDGGRSASGFVGSTGDCVTRAIAIATGIAYRDVYKDLGVAAAKTPRNGVQLHVVSDYLQRAGWTHEGSTQTPFEKAFLPRGVVIVHLVTQGRGCSHMCTVIDHVIHDTWNAADDDYIVVDRWTCASVDSDTTLPTPSGISVSDSEQLTQSEFEKILKRLVALDKTASNDASTEGEKRNALRMMQNLMLRHNLSREDITEDDNVENVLFTRIACPVNGRRAYNWERRLAGYVTDEIFPMIQWYQDRKGHRTFFWFYGPKDDVENCIALFRELLLTIATAAHLRYGGYSRGSGASYAEGYVGGLPRYSEGYSELNRTDENQVVSEHALIHARTLALHQAAEDWLDRECGVRLVRSGGSGRSQFDGAAAGQGRRDGAKHEMPTGNRQARIENR